MHLSHSSSKLNALIGFMVFIALALPIVSAYTVDGNSVYIDDSNAYIRVTPHTLSSSGYVTFDIRSKTYSGDVDLTFGFDSDFSKPKIAELYNPHYENITHSRSCPSPYWYNYTLNPNNVQCWETDNESNDIFLWSHSFDYADIGSDTIYWYEQKQVLWTDISGLFQSLDYDYDGKNKWFFKKNVPIVSGTDYKIRIWVNVPVCFNGDSSCDSGGKYDFAIKPSGETIQESVALGHLYFIDPWWNTTWGKRMPIKILNTNTTSSIPAGQVVSVALDTTGADYQDDGDDVRIMFTDDVEETWTEIPFVAFTPFNSLETRLFFKLNQSISASASSDNQYYIFYDNPTATNANYTGNQVFTWWDDFATGLNASVWADITDCAWNSEGYVHCDYDQGSGDRDLISLITAQNLTVMLVKWEVEDVTGTGAGPRWKFFGNTGNCSEARYAIENDDLAIQTAYYPAYASYYDFNEGTWYYAKLIRGQGLIDNEMWVNWQQEVVNATSICRGDAVSIGWITGEDADHNINIDTFAIYDYFFPEPNVTLETEEEPPVNVTVGVCDTDLIPLCEPYEDWTEAICLDNNTLRKTKDCVVSTTVNNVTSSCQFTKSQDFICDNGCYDGLTAIGSGCAPTNLEIIGITGAFFLIFSVASLFVMGKKRRKRR